MLKFLIVIQLNTIFLFVSDSFFKSNVEEEEVWKDVTTQSDDDVSLLLLFNSSRKRSKQYEQR